MGGNQHTCVSVPGSSTSVLQSQSLHPSGGKVWQIKKKKKEGRETKGGEKGKRKEEIEGEIYMQQLTGV